MHVVIIGVFLAVVVLLIFRSKRNTVPAEQACAVEIADLLRGDPDTDPREIAQLFEKHQIDQERLQKVGTMVMPQLRRKGFKPEDARIVMGQVRKAYPLCKHS